MPEVLVLVDAEVDEYGHVSLPSTLTGMIAALKQAISTPATVPIASLKKGDAPNQDSSHSPTGVRLISTKLLLGSNSQGTVTPSSLNQDLALKPLAEDLMWCPLTLNLPDTLVFPGQAVYRACRDVLGLRQQVAQQLKYPVGSGGLWLPVVNTTKGPLYGEVIQPVGEQQPVLENLDRLTYHQPLHLSDYWRQPLYNLGYRLLELLAAPPATYLLQFGFEAETICFDRLWPFPAAPAIASLGVQTPDLFACHWYCLTNQPVLDLMIPSSVDYQVYSTLR